VSERLGGTIPALLTPFTAGGLEVDLAALDDHAGWLHERGIRTVSPTGTTGEGASLGLEERKRVIERLARHPSGIGLLAGTGCNALPETIALSRFAVEHGAALLLAPPSYYEPFDERGVGAYFVRVFEALPPEARVVLYHVPSHTGLPITDGLLRTLRDRFGPMLAGVKDSGGDFEHTIGWLERFPELAILSGSDATAAAAYEAGAPGVVTMLANVFPQELELIRAGVESGEPVDAVQEFLRGVRAVVHELPRQSALKHLLKLVGGVDRSAVRPPLQELDEQQATYLERRFSELRSEARI
jgi:4-hydroxy-tetrahydrodipicolinate synthase